MQAVVSLLMVTLAGLIAIPVFFFGVEILAAMILPQRRIFVATKK